MATRASPTNYTHTHQPQEINDSRAGLIRATESISLITQSPHSLTHTMYIIRIKTERKIASGKVPGKLFNNQGENSRHYGTTHNASDKCTSRLRLSGTFENRAALLIVSLRGVRSLQGSPLAGAFLSKLSFSLPACARFARYVFCCACMYYNVFFRNYTRPEACFSLPMPLAFTSVYALCSLLEWFCFGGKGRYNGC